MRSSRVFWLVLPLALAACGESPAEDRLEGQASVALTNVPADVQCLRITFEGTQTVKRLWAVMPSQPATAPLDGLPLGDVIVSAEAFDQPCNTLSEGSLATWLSQGVAVTILEGVAANIGLTMHRAGRGNVTVDFPGTPVINPAPTFAAPLAVGGTSPRDFDLADLNGDGFADLISLESSAPDLFVRPGNAAGTFGAPFVTPVGQSGARALGLADWDGDGRLDVLVGFDGGGPARLLRGTGGLSFRPPIATEVSGPVTRMAVFDFDGDRHADVVTADNSNALTVYRGTVQPYFAELTRLTLPGQVSSFSVASSPFGTAALVAGLTSNTVVYLGFDGVTFGVQQLPLPGASAVALEQFAGDLELMTAAANAPISGAVFNGVGVLQPVSTGVGVASLRNIAGADLNSDGLADLVGAQAQGTGVLVYRSVGGMRLSLVSTLAANGQALRIRLAQISGDAKPDIIASTTNGFSVFRNTSP
jgi:hypothetical protein